VAFRKALRVALSVHCSGRFKVLQCFADNPGLFAFVFKSQLNIDVLFCYRVRRWSALRR